MKIKKSEAQARINAMKTAMKGHVKIQVVKGQNSSGDTIELVEPRYSISKYFRGALWNNWENAENEERIYKALGVESGTRGGFFVPEQVAGEVIPLLKAKAVVRNMPGVKVVDLTGKSKITWNRVTAGPTVSWGGESTQISEDTTLAFGQKTLDTQKAVCLYKESRELFENAGPSVDEILRTELADALALAEDKVFLEGKGGTQPLGIYYNPQVLSTDLSGAIDQDDVKVAVNQMMLQNAGEPTAWVTYPTVRSKLALLKDAEGRPIFGTGPGQMYVKEIDGAPVHATTQITSTLMPGASETYMIGGMWSGFWIGERGGIRVDTTDSGGDAFEYDQVWLRLVREVGSILRHDQAFVVIKGIDIS